MGRLILTFAGLLVLTLGVWRGIVGPPFRPAPDFGPCLEWSDEDCSRYAYPAGDGPAYQKALAAWQINMIAYRARHRW